MLATLEGLLDQGLYLRAWQEADRLLQEAHLSASEEGAVLRMGCRACIFLGNYYKAAKLGERAVQMARTAADIDTLGRAYFDLGVAYIYIGDSSLAEENLRVFLGICSKMTGAGILEGKAHFNLAIVYRQRKLWRAVIQTLQTAAALFERHGQPRQRARCALETAWSYLMLGASALAAPHLAHVEAYLGGSSGGDDDFIDLIGLKALFYRLEGDIAASSQLCQELFMPGRAGVSSLQLSLAAWVMGENALDVGHLDEASSFADIALDHAGQAICPTMMNLASSLRRRIAATVAA